MSLVRTGLRAFVLPLVAPLETAHGTIHGRAGFLVSLEDDAGRYGIGEATPLPVFGGEALEACRAALLGALEALVGIDDEVEGAGLAIVRRMGDATPCARAAVETALADLAAQRAGRSLAHWIRVRAELPGEPASAVRVQALVSGAAPEAVAASARRARAAGFDTFKLKLAVSPAARDLGADLERVAALRSAIGGAGRIRLDANEAWTRAEAEAALARLVPFDVDLLEQPVARRDLEALAFLARTSPIPIAADEALLDGGLEACLSRRIADCFVVKPALLGGIEGTISLARRAEARGIRLVYSNLIEGSVGRAAALALASGLARAGADEVHGLGTAPLLAVDFEPAPLSSPARLTPSAGPGLGARIEPCWRLEGEIFGEGRQYEGRAASSAGASSGPTPPARPAGEPGWVDDFAQRHGARDALVFGERTWGYAALARAVRTAQARLSAVGIDAGDFVAVLAPPTPEGVVLFHAMLDGGIVLLPVNARLAEPEIVAALAATRASSLLVSEAIDAGLAGRVAAAAGCRLVVFTPDEADAAPAPGLRRLGEGGGAAGRDGDRVGHVAAQARALHREQGALVLLTSGTSGRSKAAILTRANLVASADASARLLGSGAADRWLLCMPLFHIAGLSILVRAARVGACVVLESRFEAGRIAARLETGAISHVSLVATTLAQLLEARGDRRAPASLRLVLVGGGPAAEALLERAVAAGYPIAPTYGLTEAASQVATRPPGASEAPQAGGLVPLPGVELRIADADGRSVEAGLEGEIQLRGPIVMRGYLGDPEATARVLRGGWLATGDVGRLDAAGRLRVLDRRSDLILSGGENVYPAEIESLLAEHPDVVEAGVVGVADARFGARPLAFVVWRPGAARDAGELAAWCRTRLAGYKRPVDFIASETLPRNASGKLLRRELARRVPESGGSA